ncbi:hypothetical protein JXA85_02010 [Candidatus Woesearchaeota archaeon]|nr:hypothetical protein [Candidatus Woesearchaeota archaeon]
MRKKGYKISGSAIKDGLNKAFWPGRMEFIRNNILLDCAHNPHGINVLVNEIKKLNYNRLILVFGVSSDKDYTKMIKSIAPLADEIILTRTMLERGLEPGLLVEIIKNKKVIIIKSVKNAVKTAMNKAKKNDLILITGSIFVVGESRGFLGKIY